MQIPFLNQTPDFPSNAEWFNVKEPLSTRQNLKGHVIVLDFWTYCCINCIHLIPTLKKWETEFKDAPVVFVGVHAPKFQNEKENENIQSAIDRYEIEHPVINDANHDLWNALGVNAWPTIVVIAPDGKIAYKNAGERHPDLSKTIRRILDENQKNGTLTQKRFDGHAPKRTRQNTLAFPGKIDFDWKTGRLAIADSNHNRILVTELNGNEAKITHTIGTGSIGLFDGAFDLAQFFRPQGLAWHNGNLFVADTENHAIRFINLTTKTVSTLGGTGAQAPHVPGLDKNNRVVLNSPWDLLPSSEWLYIAMAGSHQIWRMRIADNRFEPFAGTGGENIVDGPRQIAFFAQPSGLASDGEHLLVADSETSSIRRVNLSDGNVSTLVGSGLFDFGKNDGSLSRAKLQHAIGLDYRKGKIFVADTYNHAIREIDETKKTMTTLIGMKNENQKVCTIGDTACHDLPLNEPNDVLALEDRLLIADTNNHLIRSFNPKTKKIEDLTIR